MLAISIHQIFYSIQMTNSVIKLCCKCVCVCECLLEYECFPYQRKQKFVSDQKHWIVNWKLSTCTVYVAVAINTNWACGLVSQQTCGPADAHTLQLCMSIRSILAYMKSVSIGRCGYFYSVSIDLTLWLFSAPGTWFCFSNPPSPLSSLSLYATSLSLYFSLTASFARVFYPLI